MCVLLGITLLLHLLPSVLFRAKTRRSDTPSLAFTIPALTPLVGHERDRLLCPVRALRHYLFRTRKVPLRKLGSQLFLPYRGNAVSVSPAMISRWICCTIFDAYSAEPDACDSDNVAVTAHQVRALSASWATTNHVPVDDVLRALSWRHATTFTSHYLRDLCHQADDLYSLGPLVVSQQVV